MYIGNYDGQREGLVMASSQKNAATVARHTVKDIKENWIPHTPTEDDLKRFKPDTLYTKKYDMRTHDRTNNVWQEGRCR